MTSFVIAFSIGIMVMHAARERTNGSKQLQMLSGTHFTTYWLSHYIFDVTIYIFNILTLVIALAIINASNSNDQTNEISTIAGTSNLGYFLLLCLFSCFSWPLMAYVCSFAFSTDIIGFVFLTGLLNSNTFMGIWVKIPGIQIWVSLVGEILPLIWLYRKGTFAKKADFRK